MSDTREEKSTKQEEFFCAKVFYSVILGTLDLSQQIICWVIKADRKSNSWRRTERDMFSAAKTELSDDEQIGTKRS